MIKNIIWVALGGSVGSVARYLLAQFIKNNSFPYATMVINITGSFIIGLVFAFYNKTDEATTFRLFLATGFCGGFTTFSAFSYENMLLIQSGKINQALLYILASVIIGITATWFGFKLINH